MRKSETRSFWAGGVATFQGTPTTTIVGALATRIGLEYAGVEKQQIKAWTTQIDLLKATFEKLANSARNWGVLVELPLLRLGRRIDAVVLIRDQIVCLEFKIGSDIAHGPAVAQVLDYALCLRDFHERSRNHKITPVLCVDGAPDFDPIPALNYVENVGPCVFTNGPQLLHALDRIHQQGTGPQMDWRAFDESSYSPTPDIVTAARALYAGHTITDIGRADASAHQLDSTATTLGHLVNTARRHKEHAVCFVTGEPGAGKTLLGLNLVLAGESGRVAGEPAAVLSGNRPLVYVLQEAIAQDAHERLGIPMGEAKRQTQQALQTLLNYLKEHSRKGGLPPESVIVFDEAQRAWDATVGSQLMGRERSEPQLFLEILGRLPWACLVCLVGLGQEINRGEGGLALWGEALREVGDQWVIYASPNALSSTAGCSALLDRVAIDGSSNIIEDDRLHLGTNLRSYRNANHGRWVEALLASDLDTAAQIADTMQWPPAEITRDLEELRAWLRQRQRGHRRVGLLASSGAVRLVANGIPPSPRSSELNTVAHWFLRPTDDYRSSNTLETPLSEFVCQGLEIDYAGLIWGNDLAWSRPSASGLTAGTWIPREMRAPKWSVRRNAQKRQHRLNAYRVLLTRARAGLGILVPYGELGDPTRHPAEFDFIYSALCAAGCKKMGL